MWQFVLQTSTILPTAYRLRAKVVVFTHFHAERWIGVEFTFCQQPNYLFRVWKSFMCTNKWSNIENSSENLCSQMKNRSNLCVSLSSYIHSSNAHLSLMMVMISVTETIFPCMHLQITVCHNYTCFISAHIHHLNLLLHKFSLCTIMNADSRQHYAHQTLCKGAFTQIFRNKCKKIWVWWIWSHILNPSPFLTLHESRTFTFASCRHLIIDFFTGNSFSFW